MRNDEPEYLRLNRANWNDRAAIHAGSPDYQVQRFIENPGLLSKVVRFDQPRLGDVSGLTGVHLQCHIGTDTLSLARLGARMTGLDFSGASLAVARRLAQATGAPIRFVEADVYRAAELLGPGQFDLVYVSIGALSWLPSVDRWAQEVAALLKPGGRLFIREVHPMLSTRADDCAGGFRIEHPYFEQVAPIVFDEAGTYVAPAEGGPNRVTNTTTHEWNHGIGEVVTAVLAHGLTVTMLVEHDSVPFLAMPGWTVLDEVRGEWRLGDRPERLAASFTLGAEKPR